MCFVHNRQGCFFVRFVVPVPQDNSNNNQPKTNNHSQQLTSFGWLGFLLRGVWRHASNSLTTHRH